MGIGRRSFLQEEDQGQDRQCSRQEKDVPGRIRSPVWKTVRPQEEGGGKSQSPSREKPVHGRSGHL